MLILLVFDLDVTTKRQLKKITLTQYHDPAGLRAFSKPGSGESAFQQPVDGVAPAALDEDEGQVFGVLAD